MSAPVSPEARRAFAVFCEGMSAHGASLSGDIAQHLSKNWAEDLAVCVDDPSSPNHARAVGAGLAVAGEPFVHVRPRRKCFVPAVAAFRAPAGHLWVQVSFCDGGELLYEYGAAKLLMVNNSVAGVVMTASAFDEVAL